jgi:hypothetical protein
MTEPAYPAARAVAGKVRAHFVGHLEAARRAGQTHLAADPEAGAIEALIDTAFWASLRREEGIEPQISLALVSPDQASLPLRFRDALALDAASLAKLAPAVERAGIHLGVWPEDGTLRVWGTTRSLPAYCFVIEVVASGLLVVKQRSESFGKFVNVAVLEGDQVKFVDEHAAVGPACPPVLRSLLGFDMSTPGVPAGVMVQIAASMRGHRRGGALLRVPAGSEDWKESIVGPIPYAVTPPYGELADLVRRYPADGDGHEWQDELRHVVDAIAGLTAVDGATLIDETYDVLAFGAKIRPRSGSPPLEQVVVSEPIEGSEVIHTTPTRLGGTRHLSAAQFVHDQRDATAFVASQDGRFTIFRWSESERMAHAFRVEALLL